MLDGDFSLPLPGNKLPDFGSVITRGCRKVFSIRAEGDIVHPTRMPDGGFFQPLPSNKPPDFSGVVHRGCRKVSSIRAKGSIDHPVKMPDGVYILASQKPCLREHYSNGEKQHLREVMMLKKGI